MELEGWMKNERLSIHLGLLFCILPNWKDEGRIDGAFKDGLWNWQNSYTQCGGFWVQITTLETKKKKATLPNKRPTNTQ